MICPHCGKEADGYTIVHSQQLSGTLNIAGSAILSVSAVQQKPIDVSGAVAFTPLAVNATACSNIGMGAHYHVVNL